MFFVSRSRRRLSSRDPPGASDHHRPNARPSSDSAQPSARHHADHHASDSPDPELGPRTGSQSASGAGAARARVWDHLHAIRVSLHTHTLHIGISHRLDWSFRYVNTRSSSLSYIVNGCIRRTGYLSPIRLRSRCCWIRWFHSEVRLMRPPSGIHTPSCHCDCWSRSPWRRASNQSETGNRAANLTCRMQLLAFKCSSCNTSTTQTGAC